MRKPQACLRSTAPSSMSVNERVHLLHTISCTKMNQWRWDSFHSPHRSAITTKIQTLIAIVHLQQSHCLLNEQQKDLRLSGLQSNELSVRSEVKGKSSPVMLILLISIRLHECHAYKCTVPQFHRKYESRQTAGCWFNDREQLWPSDLISRHTRSHSFFIETQLYPVVLRLLSLTNP